MSDTPSQTARRQAECEEEEGMSQEQDNTSRWKLDLDAPAKVWSNAPFPSKASRAKACRAILAFVETLPGDATISDLRAELEQWM